MRPYLQLSSEVEQAKRTGGAIVALESTIISHGMPYPQNLETARMVEKIIRDAGATPATVAIMDGRVRIGLSDADLVLFAQSRDAFKASRRDMGWLLARRKLGATTVAATMICAHMAEIPIFVTGGIGGVHRGGAQTMDVSADLEELAQTSVAVVCGGAKSILDLSLTMEYLETKGVPVIGYRCDYLPGFYTRSSGIALSQRADNVQEIALDLKTKWDLGLKGGVVVANPVPEAYAMDPALINRIIDQALAEAEQRGIYGKETTPFLLAKVKELTGGSSLVANIELIKNNALLGAQLALAYHGLSV